MTVVDINADRIDRWCGDDLPIFEPGLDPIVKARRGINLFFSTDIDSAIEAADAIFVSVNTPTKTSGVGAGFAADLVYIESAMRRIATVATSSKVIVEKSTVPCRTAESMRKILAANANTNVHFEVLSNPEFLAEGTAVQDLLNPDRVLIGSLDTISGNQARSDLVDVYARWVSRDKIVTTGLWSSELTKLAANAMLAQRVSSVNSLSQICEETGADIDEVTSACGMDSRIGDKFLRAGLGFGGSCFKKDILNLVYIARSLFLDDVADYWEQVLAMNTSQNNRFAEKIVRTMFNTVTGKVIGVLGASFKKDTGDTRESPSVSLIRKLLDEGARVRVYDPKVTKDQLIRDLATSDHNLQINLRMMSDPYAMAHGADALVIATEWDEFKALNFASLKSLMNRPAFLFDGRRVLNAAKRVDECISLGFKVVSIGS